MDAIQIFKQAKGRLKEDDAHPGMKMIYGQWRKTGGGNQAAPQPVQRQGSRASYMPQTPLPDKTQLQQPGQPPQQPAPKPGEPGAQQPGGQGQQQQPDQQPGQIDPAAAIGAMMTPEDQQKIQVVSKSLGINPKTATIAVGVIGAAAAIANIGAVGRAVAFLARNAPKAIATARSSRVSQSIGKAINSGAESVRTAWRNGGKDWFFGAAKTAAVDTAIQGAVSVASGGRVKESRRNIMEEMRIREAMARPGVKISRKKA